jgi:hypothetical protein
MKEKIDRRKYCERRGSEDSRDDRPQYCPSLAIDSNSVCAVNCERIEGTESGVRRD